MTRTAEWAGTRYESCERKIRYLRMRTANRAIRAMAKRGKPVAHLHAYACRFCDGWHVGNDRGRR